MFALQPEFHPEVLATTTIYSVPQVFAQTTNVLVCH
jgi:hypothetical protein